MAPNRTLLLQIIEESGPHVVDNLVASVELKSLLVKVGR